MDRVELAYLRHLVHDDIPLYLLVRTWLGYLVLNQAGAEAVLARLDGTTRWGPVDMLGRLQRKAHPKKRRAEADLRRFAIGRARRGRLPRLLQRTFKGRVCYVNVGHSNLSEEVLSSWSNLERSRISVLVHDMIPLDFPQFQRHGSVAQFEARMRRVARYAGHIICISEATRERVAHWFKDWGRDVPSTVAPLGVDFAEPDAGQLPDGLPPQGPYFVTVGTIEPRKNHALLLDLWGELIGELKHAPTLVVAGARGWRNEDMFARLDAGPKGVIEAAGLSDAALSALVAGSAGLLFPTHAEGFGLPPIEARALGVPVICSDLPVLREFGGKTTIYANADDMYAWKQEILKLTGQFEAKRTVGADDQYPFEAPSWANHFNLALKVL